MNLTALRGTCIFAVAISVVGCENNKQNSELPRPPFNESYIYENGLWESFHAQLIRCNSRGEVELIRDDQPYFVLLDGIKGGPHAASEIQNFVNRLKGQAVYVKKFRGLSNHRPASRLSDIWYLHHSGNKWILLNEQLIRNGLARHEVTLPGSVSLGFYIPKAQAEELAKSKGVGIWSKRSPLPLNDE